MAIPSTALVWEEPMDPYDVVDYTIDVSALIGEDSVDVFSVSPMVESSLLGLTVGTEDYAPILVNGGSKIQLWLSIETSKQHDPSFSGPGVTLPLEVSVTTSSVPPRKRQRTVVVKVMQR